MATPPRHRPTPRRRQAARVRPVCTVNVTVATACLLGAAASSCELTRAMPDERRPRDGPNHEQLLPAWKVDPSQSVARADSNGGGTGEGQRVHSRQSLACEVELRCPMGPPRGPLSTLSLVARRSRRPTGAFGSRVRCTAARRDRGEATLGARQWSKENAMGFSSTSKELASRMPCYKLGSLKHETKQIICAFACIGGTALMSLLRRPRAGWATPRPMRRWCSRNLRRSWRSYHVWVGA